MTMRSLRSIFAAVCLSTAALAVAGCGGSEGPKVANVKPGPMPEGQQWNGVYYHQVYGFLHLQQEGETIVGRWKRTDQSYWGEMSGTVTGNVVHYTWKEHKIGMVGAASTTHGKGYFVYTVNKDGIGFLKGEYGLNDDDSGSEWSCLKQDRQQPDLKSIGGDGEGVTPGQLSN